MEKKGKTISYGLEIENQMSSFVEKEITKYVLKIKFSLRNVNCNYGANLVERIALITGSSSGIGKAITQKFLCDGYTVIGLARDHSKFSPDCNQYHPLSVDLSNVIALEKTIPRIIKKYQNINVFISNAGFGDFEI